MERLKKEEIVEALRGIFESTNLVVVTQFSGLSVAEASDLRRQMRAAGATFRVTKNRLAKRAVEGTTFAPLADLFAGSSAIAYSDDPVAAAKVAVAYAKENDKLIIVGGALGGAALDKGDVRSLAELPSLDTPARPADRRPECTGDQDRRRAERAGRPARARPQRLFGTRRHR